MSDPSITDRRHAALLGRPDQIGVVVGDLDRAAAGVRRVFGIEAHFRNENEYRRTEYRGRPIDGTVGVMLDDAVPLLGFLTEMLDIGARKS